MFDYDGPAELWNIAVAVGHALMALVVVAFVGLVLRSTRGGEPAGDDPWGGQTLEWLTTSPAPATNFAETPTVMSPEPVLDLHGRTVRWSPTAGLHAPCPPAPAPPPRRQVLVGTALAGGGDADAHRRDARHLDPDA